MSEPLGGSVFGDALIDIAKRDVGTLLEKDRDYGSSWKKRGGVGAFMMLARKWDRLETLTQKYGWDIFEAVESSKDTYEPVLETIRDLRRYLLLVEQEVCKK